MPISLHLGNTLFFLNQSIISYLSLNKKKPVADAHRLNKEITNNQLGLSVCISYQEKIVVFDCDDPKMYPITDDATDPTKTIIHIFCIEFIAQFNNYKNLNFSSNLFPKKTLDIVTTLRKGGIV